MNRDLEHLKLLSIFHYVVAGLVALFSMIPLIHLSLGVAMLAGAFEQTADPPPRWLGIIFVFVATLLIGGGMSLALALAVAGRFLARQRHYVYCFVVACISCIFTPFGTVLGVFTLIVLLRGSVKQLFGRPAPDMKVSS